MAITEFDHVSILAADAGAVADFYARFLDFREVGRRELPGMHLLDLARGNQHLEVIQPTEGDPPRAGGIKHIAFRSNAIEEDFARFVDAGARFMHADIQRSTGCAYFFVRSPGGEWVEIIQYDEGTAAP